MASQLKVILAFNIPGGGSQSLPHGLNWNGTPVVPDYIVPDAGTGFEITADDTNVTVTGVGSVNVLCESWHTIEREFGGVQITALSPQPFVSGGDPPTPPFDLTTITLYVRPGGQDRPNRGTLAKPFATLQYALRNVPNILDPGVGYVIDITGITETLPADYEFPVILSSSLNNGGLTVTATPRLTTLLSSAAAKITAADAATISSGVGAPVPSSNLVVLTVATLGKWGAINLKGKQLVRSSQGLNGPAACTIYGNDATHLYLCQDSEGLNGTAPAVGTPLNLTGGDTLQIVEPSATLTALPPTVNFAAISCWAVSEITFEGIHFATPTPGLNPALAIGNTSTPATIGCVVEGVYAINTPNALYFDASSIQISYDIEPCPTVMQRCLFSNFNTPGSYFYIAAILQTFKDIVFDNTCPTLAPGSFNNAILPSNWGFQNILFQGSTGDAIQATNGQWGLVNVEIDNAAGNAITVSGGGATFVTMTSVGGTGSTGYGVRAINGSRVLVDPITMVDPIAVTGALGDTKSGNLAVTTWTQVGDGKAYDLPLNQPLIANATGTCIQLLDVA